MGTFLEDFGETHLFDIFQSWVGDHSAIPQGAIRILNFSRNLGAAARNQPGYEQISRQPQETIVKQETLMTSHVWGIRENLNYNVYLKEPTLECNEGFVVFRVLHIFHILFRGTTASMVSHFIFSCIIGIGVDGV